MEARTRAMRISRLELAGAGDRPEVIIDQPGYGLNVITGRSGVCKSELAACMAHLLYGRRAIQLEPTSGSIDIETELGNFRLRRDAPPGGLCRLTIAGLGQATATAETISKVLRGCSTEFLAGLYVLDGKQSPRIDWLLSERVAANVLLLCREQNSSFDDRHRQEELLAQRDEFAQQVAQLLAERRRTSESIARHLEDLARRRAEMLAGIEAVREKLHAVDAELAEISAQARYHELETLADQTARSTDRPDEALRLDEIDDQIERWRTTLHDLQRRESQVRTELARHRPTDSAAALPLADQRAALAVTERLVQDLQGEIARFARSVTSSTCVCRDAHPRLHPLVTLLEQQVRRLVTLTDEHERVARSQELLGEAQHLSRSQAELRDQLEHLQTQRESLSRRARPRRWRPSETIEAQRSTDLPDLERKRRRFSDELEERRKQLRELDQRYERALAERKCMLSDRLLDQKQAELAEIQHRLQPSGRVHEPSLHVSESSPHGRHRTRSSDYLAQLSDSQFIELKLTAGGRRAFVVDRHARTFAVESLPLAEQHLVALSLSLAVIAGLSETGFQLPVILDEPFAQPNDRQTAILAGVLQDFSGQQLFVFTDRHAALEHFRAWGATIHNLHDSYRPVAIPPVAPRHFPEDPLADQKPALRIKRERPNNKRRGKSIDERNQDERPKNRRPSRKQPPLLKFHLELQSPIGEAPSITPEIAEQLSAAGIRQVRDLLAADASKLAARLAVREIEAVEIVAWQHQARLCCRIPNLRASEAAILVGAGFSTPEDVASMKPAELHGFIQSFAQIDEGRQLLGNDGAPDLATVEGWIRAARHSRGLGAA